MTIIDQLRHFVIDLFIYDAMFDALCSKIERFSESMAKLFNDSGSSMYIFLDNLPSQTGVCLNNRRK